MRGLKALSHGLWYDHMVEKCATCIAGKFKGKHEAIILLCYYTWFFSFIASGIKRANFIQRLSIIKS